MDPSGMKASSPHRTPPRSSPIAQHAQSRTTPPLQSKPDQHNLAPSRPMTDARHLDSGPSGHAHLLNPDKDHPSSILASMLSQALHDADSWKEKYVAEKRRADYFERMYEAFKGAFEPYSQPGSSTNAQSSTANAPASNAKDSPSAPPRLTSPNSVSKSIKQLADALHHTEYERDEERARRLCLTDLWSQLRDYLDVIESHSRQARRAFDRRVDGLSIPGAVGGENLVREERERFVEVRAPIPSLLDVLHQFGHPNIYDSTGRKRQRHPSPSPSHHPHSPVNSHGQPNAKRPRTHNSHSQGQGQQQIYLDPSPAPGYIFQEYHPPPPPPHANTLPPPHGNSASSSSHHLPPPASSHNSTPTGGRDHPPPPPLAPGGSGPGPSREVQGKGFTYTTFHSRSDTQTQRGRPPAGAGSRKGRSRSRSSSSSKSLDEMLLDTTTSSATHGINNPSITSLPPIQSLAPGHNHLPPITSSSRERADSHSTRSSGRSPPILVLDRNADRALEKGLLGAGGERVGGGSFFKFRV